VWSSGHVTNVSGIAVKGKHGSNVWQKGREHIEGRFVLRVILGSIIAVHYMETMKIAMTRSWVPMERDGVCSVKRDPIGFLAWANGCEGAFLSRKVGTTASSNICVQLTLFLDYLLRWVGWGAMNS
jgi:hypothetical protein